MGIEGLPTQLMQIPFGAGINQRGDKRAQNPPILDIAKDVQFEEIGGLQTRHPLTATGLNILGGGTIAAADVRRVEQNGDELLLFTKDSLYSRDVSGSLWILRGTHLAVASDEQTVFSTTDDQIDCDRAELNGTVITVWGATTGSCFIAASDKTTGATILAPTPFTDGTRPRILALQTKFVLLFVNSDPSLHYLVIDPANVAGSLSGEVSILESPNMNSYYDVAAVPGADTAVVVARRTTTTSYRIAKITTGGSVTALDKARTADGPLAVSVTPDGTKAQVARGNGTNIQGDLITVSALADSITGQAIGTGTGTINQIAACHRTVQNSGHNRCYVFWSSSESNTNTFATKFNWVDDAGTLGTQATFVNELGVASRAFDYNGSVYVWLTFAGLSQYTVGSPPVGKAVGALQNTYFLYRDDTFLTAKAVGGSGGGFSASTGHLPGVALISGTTGYAWCGVERRIVPVGTASGSPGAYSARAPRDITFSFDDNRARRCARVGQTLYIAGSIILAYDGAQIVEAGWLIYPWNLHAEKTATGNLADGGYTIKVTERFDNAKGERDRSTTATVVSIGITGGPQGMTIQYTPLYVTRKTTPKTAIEIWRTAKDGTNLFLSSSLDPTKTSPNQYLTNDTTAVGFQSFKDELSDASLTVNEADPETGGVLENLVPPSANIILATDVRIFLAGIAGEPDQVAYSKQRSDGQMAEFNDALVFTVPPDGGDITALANLEGTLVVFRETATYAFPGAGFDNVGGGANYGPGRIVALDLGAVSMESVCVGDDGIYVKTLRGWHLLDKAFTYHYIGASTFNSDPESVLAIQIMRTQQQVRILTTGRMLLFDMVTAQWAEWTITDGVHATLWNNTHVYLSNVNGPMLQRTDFTGVTYGLDVETAWIKFNDLQGRALVRMISLLGEVQAACSLRIRMARNYESDGAGGWNYNYDQTWLVTPTTVGAPLQLEVAPKFKRCQTIKFRITALGTDKVNAPTGDTVKLTGLALAYALEEEMFQGITTAQRQ